MDFPLGVIPSMPIRVVDNATGAPVATGVTAAWQLFGPASATVPVDSGVAVTNRGGGVWTADGAVALNVAGNYRLVYDITLPASAAVQSQEVGFTVGVPVRGAWTMRDLLVAIIRSVGGSVRPSSLINAAVVTDPYWVGGGTLTIPTEEFLGTELVLIDPATAASYADWFVGRVTAFDGTTGNFTVNRTTGLVSDATGRRYALTNVGGTGFMFEHILEELRVAYDEVQPTIPVSFSVGYDIAQNQLEYVLPETLVSVSAVGVHSPGVVDLWDDLGGKWEVLRDRRLLRINEGLGLGPNDTLRIAGKVRSELPRLGGGLTDIAGAWLRERVRFGLLSSSPSQAHQRTAQVVYTNLLRMPDPRTPHLPGERRLY